MTFDPVRFRFFRRCPLKKRFPALLLAFCLLLTTPALAVSDSTEHFIRTKTYSGQFSDLTPDSVFYDNVAALYEYGLSVGKPDGTYGLQNSMTVGQIVIFAGRIRSLYRTGDAEEGAASYSDSGSLVQSYLRYLQEEGVVGTELDDSLTAPATRAQVAHVLANALPEEALPAVNSDLVTQAYASRKFITDVTEYTDYQQDILKLYRCGVCVGSDDTGSFLPDQPITRGAAAAMLTRMVDDSLRLIPGWDLSRLYSAQGTTLASLVEPAAYIAAPQTDEEIDAAVRYMLSVGSSTLTLQYGTPINAIFARGIMQRALSAVKTYCEQCYNTVSCTYTISGAVVLTFSAASAGDRLEEYRQETLSSAIAVHDQLWAAGAITDAMTELEKARVYYTWICENTVYDYEADASSLSHIPYSLFHNGTAVCDGYTGAYNLLLKLEGIQCSTISNTEHIWTLAVLDGTQYHIDTTWGDSGSTISYDYFAMSPSQSWSYHSW